MAGVEDPVTVATARVSSVVLALCLVPGCLAPVFAQDRPVVGC